MPTNTITGQSQLILTKANPNEASNPNQAQLTSLDGTKQKYNITLINNGKVVIHNNENEIKEVAERVAYCAQKELMSRGKLLQKGEYFDQVVIDLVTIKASVATRRTNDIFIATNSKVYANGQETALTPHPVDLGSLLVGQRNKVIHRDQNHETQLEKDARNYRLNEKYQRMELYSEIGPVLKSKKEERKRLEDRIENLEVRIRHAHHRKNHKTIEKLKNDIAQCQEEIKTIEQDVKSLEALFS